MATASTKNTEVRKMSEGFKEQQKKKFADFLEKGAKKIESLEETVCQEHGTLIEDCENSSVCRLFNSEDDQNDFFNDFDMYAQDVKKWDWLQQFVPGVVVYSAGGMCPFQAEGYIGDLNFYYRERGGFASLNLANSKKECYLLSDALYSAEIEVEEFRPASEWVGTFLTLVERLEKPKFLYHFQTDAIDLKKLDEEGIIQNRYDENGNVVHETKAGWGHSVEEAFAQAADFEVFRLIVMNREKYDGTTGKSTPDSERSWSEEKFNKFLALTNIQPIVVKIEGDNRVYPVHEPVFEVKVPETWRNEEGVIVLPAE